MSDNYYARLRIREEDYQKPMVKAILDSYTFDNISTTDGIVELADKSAEDGKFEEEEANLIKTGIPFDRESETYYCDNPARKRVFRPETKARGMLDKTYTLTTDSKPLVDGTLLGKILTESAETTQQKVDQLNRVRDLYEESCFTGPELKDMISEVSHKTVVWEEVEPLVYVKRTPPSLMTVVDARYKKHAGIRTTTIDVDNINASFYYRLDLTAYLDGCASIEDLKRKKPDNWESILAKNIAQLDYFAKNATQPATMIPADHIFVDPKDGKIKISVCPQCMIKYDLPPNLIDTDNPYTGPCSLSGCKNLSTSRCIIS